MVVKVDNLQSAKELIKDIHNEALLTDNQIYEGNIDEAMCSLYRLSAWADSAAELLKESYGHKI